MANRLQLKRGTTTPGSIFYEGEPIYNKTSKVLYVGDDGGSGSGTGSAVASAAAYSAVAELLTAASSSAGGSVKFYEDTDNGNNYVALAAPASIASNATFVLPATDGSNGSVLVTDGAGNLSFSSPTSSSFTLAADSGTNDTFNTGETLTFTGGTGISATVSDNQISYGLDAELQALSSVTSAADALPYFTGSGTASVTTLSSFGRTLIDDADAATARTTLGVDAAGTDNSTNVTLVTTTADYLSIAGQAITLGQIDLTTDVTGALPNANLANSTVSYGGVQLSLGGSDSTPAFDLADATNYPASSLTGTVANNQLANSTITVTDGTTSTATALGGTITFAGTANEVTVAESSGTITVGLPDDVTIGNDLTVTGNLYVTGTTTQVNTSSMTVEDRTIELGLVDGSAPSTTTTWDSGVAFNYFQTSAKKSGVVWLNNQFIAMLSELTDGGGTDNDSPQITVGAYAPVAAGSLYIGGIGAGNEVINSTQEAVNLIFDGGSY